MPVNTISRIILTTLILFMSGISGSTELPPLTHTLTAIHKPMPAPNLHLPDLDDKMIDIKDFKGKVVVVNFWTSWCPPCRREMGSLERLRLATNNKNIEILAVNIGEDMDTVFSFTGTVEPAPGFTLLLDADAISMKDWNVKGLPTTYVVSPNGHIVYSAVGGREFDHPDIQKIISNLAKK